MKSKPQCPILYLDIDGVVYYYPRRGCKTGHQVEIRPHFIRFLKTVHDCNYELRLLTANPEGGRALLNAVKWSGQYFRGWDLDQVPSCYWNQEYNNYMGGSLNKSCFIDFSRDFLWIEDGILETEMEMLEEYGVLGRYLSVDPQKPMELVRAARWVREHELTMEYSSRLCLWENKE